MRMYLGKMISGRFFFCNSIFCQILHCGSDPGGGVRLRSILDGMCEHSFFEKTHFEGIQYVKIVPIMNGLPITMYP